MPDAGVELTLASPLETDMRSYFRAVLPWRTAHDPLEGCVSEPARCGPAADAGVGAPRCRTAELFQVLNRPDYSGKFQILRVPSLVRVPAQ
ncbi:MAG: hypothetical protein JWL84_1806 [Rhodospirillales bacterium]|jgi:hypothetical protein|nr:hypothetical protein [Rhodospirillales bacterium]